MFTTLCNFAQKIFITYVISFCRYDVYIEDYKLGNIIVKQGGVYDFLVQQDYTAATTSVSFSTAVLLSSFPNVKFVVGKVSEQK